MFAYIGTADLNFQNVFTERGLTCLGCFALAGIHTNAHGFICLNVVSEFPVFEAYNPISQFTDLGENCRQGLVADLGKGFMEVSHCVPLHCSGVVMRNNRDMDSRL